MLKRFSSEKEPSPVKIGPHNCGFGEYKGKILNNIIVTPKKILPYTKQRLLTYFVVALLKNHAKTNKKLVTPEARQNHVFGGAKILYGRQSCTLTS